MKLGMTEEAVKVLTQFLDDNDVQEAHHGDCVGADVTFHEKVDEAKAKIVIHPPSVSTMREYCKPNTNGEIRILLIAQIC